ncbi:GNAT family N-acetyltransferase [Lentilactobacillus parafarraginis]|uniref:Acetyltransferase, GNAT family n=2 Tax=Lentilactobacillus parafarraginis TaxID=390842 RepID=A0A0R1YG16_9LACO|nr:GNAT family N-acetyltransferase [Lentilactobacillus parafarraginis]KRM41440.1 acetyltransferase, GNAT family [Lentilactobacillus parafarraginis DSM 18390 = JCM 14109]TLQ18002.1 GNAT family N-acetyltransferase [Lentilactobacillus parafarraginis]
MKIHFDTAKPTELAAIMRIEHTGFTPQEAATSAAMADRIRFYPDTFITAKTETDQIAGYIVGPAFDHRYLTDELYEKAAPNNPSDPYQTVLSLVVDPAFQQQGIASQLLNQLAAVAIRQGRKAITLTCLAKLVSFYERNGYKNEGVADSDHANETWFNMVKTLSQN